MPSHVITRRPGPDLTAGLTTATLGTPDFGLACRQHDAYLAALGDLGLVVEVLPPLPGHPDACFVEDTAIVVPEGALITNPGAPSRRGETASVAAALARHRELTFMPEAGRLDGGDVLVAGRYAWIGLSARTDGPGAAFLAAWLDARGYEARTVPVGAGLHFKSSVNWLGGRTLLVTEAFAGHEALAGWEQMVVPETEAYAANTLAIAGALITPEGYPATRARLDDLEVPVVELDLSEFRKVDGGLTCLSLRF